VNRCETKHPRVRGQKQPQPGSQYRSPTPSGSRVTASPREDSTHLPDDRGHFQRLQRHAGPGSPQRTDKRTCAPCVLRSRAARKLWARRRISLRPSAGAGPLERPPLAAGAAAGPVRPLQRWAGVAGDRRSGRPVHGRLRAAEPGAGPGWPAGLGQCFSDLNPGHVWSRLWRLAVDGPGPAAAGREGGGVPRHSMGWASRGGVGGR
jgi:hypothetical protein